MNVSSGSGGAESAQGSDIVSQGGALLIRSRCLFGLNDGHCMNRSDDTIGTEESE